MATTSFRALTLFSDPRDVATTSATSSAIIDYIVGPESVILFMPTNAAGAAELAAGGMYVSARAKNTFTITHASAGTTRTFDYVVIG